ncbi:MAG: ABC transporter ATP-binding protein/permease [Thermoguttaceae bacterium]|nr:ABC transporter ATP-binding protein/permease [Thermoguttaceae bacterium]
MRNFWRAIRLTFRYWGTIIATVTSALFLAFFWGANITAVLPLVEVSFQGETVSQYWQRQLADKRAKIDELRAEAETLRVELAGRLDAKGRLTAAKDDPSYSEQKEELRRLHEAENQGAFYEKSVVWFEKLTPWVEKYTPKTPFGTVAALMALVMAGTIIKSVFTFCHAYFSTKIGLLGVYELRELFFRKAVELEVDYYSQRGVADTMSRFTNDMGALSGGITIFYGKLVREPLKLFACLIGALLVSWQLLVATFIFIPATVCIISALARKLKKVVRNSMQEMVSMYARIGETFRSIRIVKVFNQEKKEEERFRQTNDANYRRAMKTTKYGSLVSPITETLGMSILITAILLGAWLAISGETHIGPFPMASHPLTLGEIILFYGFLIGAADPARRLSDIIVNLQSGVTAADRVYEIIDRQNTIRETADPKPLERFRDKITFENVSFSYDVESNRIAEEIRKTEKDHYHPPKPIENPRYVLRDINLEIPFGETLAIIGPSGSGKSTLLSLIPRFIDPVEGLAAVDGVPIRDLSLFDLRKEIGLISQTPILFDGTVEENIRYGTEGKSFDEVVEAARRAYAHDFITKELADGYRTQVGQGGSLLSGGQMQRISIARAILKDPRILLLDEATSQIDMQSELLFHNALRGFVGSRTTVIVTHRTGALALADRIVIMNEGKIDRIGTHRELMAGSPYYRELFSAETPAG